jgi:hypothetical protein
MDTRDDTRSNWQAEAGVRAPRPGERPAGWGSLLVFAGVMLAVVGLFQAMTGLTALFNDEILVVRSDALIVALDYTYWGWVHLLLGAVALVASYLLLRGNMVGRVVATVIAVVNVLVSFAFLPAQPWWSLLTIAFNVVVIYAITTHGAELKSRR